MGVTLVILEKTMNDKWVQGFRSIRTLIFYSNCVMPRSRVTVIWMTMQNNAVSVTQVHFGIYCDLIPLGFGRVARYQQPLEHVGIHGIALCVCKIAPRFCQPRYHKNAVLHAKSRLHRFGS